MGLLLCLCQVHAVSALFCWTLASILPEPMYWIWNLTDLQFLRSHVVAPVAEEFVFRACMMPLLLQCFHPMTAIFIAPLFFGVGM